MKATLENFFLSDRIFVLAIIIILSAVWYIGRQDREQQLPTSPPVPAEEPAMIKNQSVELTLSLLTRIGEEHFSKNSNMFVAWEKDHDEFQRDSLGNLFINVEYSINGNGGVSISGRSRVNILNINDKIVIVCDSTYCRTSFEDKTTIINSFIAAMNDIFEYKDDEIVSGYAKIY